MSTDNLPAMTTMPFKRAHTHDGAQPIVVKETTKELPKERKSAFSVAVEQMAKSALAIFLGRSDSPATESQQPIQDDSKMTLSKPVLHRSKSGPMKAKKAKAERQFEPLVVPPLGTCAVCLEKHVETSLKRVCSNAKCSGLFCKGCFNEFLEANHTKGWGVCRPVKCPLCLVYVPVSAWSPLATEANVKKFEQHAYNVLTLQCSGCHTRKTMLPPWHNNDVKSLREQLEKSLRAASDEKVTETLFTALDSFMDGKIDVEECYNTTVKCNPGEKVKASMEQQLGEARQELSTKTNKFLVWRKKNKAMAKLRKLLQTRKNEVEQQKKAVASATAAAQSVQSQIAGMKGSISFDDAASKLQTFFGKRLLRAQGVETKSVSTAAAPTAIPVAPPIEESLAKIPVGGWLEQAGQRVLSPAETDVLQELEEELVKLRLNVAAEAKKAEECDAASKEVTKEIEAKEAAYKEEEGMKALKATIQRLEKELQTFDPVSTFMSQVLEVLPDPERRAAFMQHSLLIHPTVRTYCCKVDHCYRCQIRGKNHKTREDCEKYQSSVSSEVRFCPQCGIALVKGDGCDSINCVCGKNFNWAAAKKATE